MTPFNDSGTGLWGYKNAAGDVVIPAQFAVVGIFVQPEAMIAPVLFAHGDNGFVWIDLQGDKLPYKPFLFDNWPDMFSEGFSRYVAAPVDAEPDAGGEKYGFINTKGEPAIPAQFDFVLPFENGRAAFCQGCTRVYYGEHWSMEGGTWGCIDTSGKVLSKNGKEGKSACSE